MIDAHHGGLSLTATGNRKMPGTASTALIALLVFGVPSVVLADTNNRTSHHDLFVQRPMSSTMFDGRTRAVNDTAKPFNAEEKGSFAASPLVPSAAFCRGGSSGRSKPWIELTGPGGEPVHINVVQIVPSGLIPKYLERGLSSIWRAGNFKACRKLSSRSCS